MVDKIKPLMLVFVQTNPINNDYSNELILFIDTFFEYDLNFYTHL